MTSIPTQDHADLPPAAAALDAAAEWLDRAGAPADAVVVVGVQPDATLGIWMLGQEHVGTLREIDGNGAEVMRACAPLVEQALLSVDESVLRAFQTAMAQGARLQLLLCPAAGEAVLRLTHPGGHAVQVGVLQAERPVLQ